MVSNGGVKSLDISFVCNYRPIGINEFYAQFGEEDKKNCFSLSIVTDMFNVYRRRNVFSMSIFFTNAFISRPPSFTCTSSYFHAL